MKPVVNLGKEIKTDMLFTVITQESFKYLQIDFHWETKGCQGAGTH